MADDLNPGVSLDTEPLLSIKGIHKSYASPVLVDVNLEVYPGEVHALVGANGAGKSTLARIISGLTHPEQGYMTLEGIPFAPKDKAEAEHRGVSMVMQELNLVGTLSIAENIFLNRLPRRFGFIDRRQLMKNARRALDAVGLQAIDTSIPVSHLGVGRQQLVEIAAALARFSRILILDEPTAALTDPEINLLFDHIRNLKQQGIGIIYISHRMEEIRTIADRVTVLRDGRVIETRPAKTFSIPEMVRLMVGREIADVFDLGERKIGSVALRVEGLTRENIIEDVSFEVRSGEIFGIAGLIGSGRTEILRAIFGADRLDRGAVYLGTSTKPLRIGLPRDAVRAGIGLIPEDRKEHGLLLSLPLRVNATLTHLRSVTEARIWIKRMTETQVAERLSKSLEVHTRSVEQPVLQLSGGNQQKVVLAKWLLRDCKILLFDEPTRGIDVASKWTIYGLLGELARQGKAIVLVSSELTELMALSDRIAVMSAGKLVKTFNRGAWTQDEILEAAFSQYVNQNVVQGRKTIPV